MRKIAGLAAVLLLGTAGAAYGIAESRVAGSPHDLARRAPDGTLDICSFCHILQDRDLGKPPLWAPGDSERGRFPVFGGLGGDEPGSSQTYGISMVCLSCHDAVIAIDVPLVPATAFGRFGAIPGGGAGDGFHPVSIFYDWLADATFRRPDGGRVGALPLFAADGGRGAGVRVECPSCHNPHEIAFGRFLRVNNRGSALCRNCHDK